MAIEHKNLTGSNLHEPKGADAAAAGNVFRANGAGSGAWVLLSPNGDFHFTDLTTPSTMSLTTSYAKMDDAAMSTNFQTDAVSAEMTYADGRITYTGALSRHFNIRVGMSIDHTSGVSRDIQFAVYKNGAAIHHAQMIMTATSAFKVSGNLLSDIALSTGDYVEIYTLADAAITLNIYNCYLGIDGGVLG